MRLLLKSPSVLIFIFAAYELCSGIDPAAFADVGGLNGIRSCGKNNLGDLVAVYLTGCKKAPCTFKKSDNLEMFIAGTIYENHDSLKATLNFTVNNGGHPIQVANLNACEHLMEGLSCPLKTGRKYIYSVDVDLAHLPEPILKDAKTLDLTIAVVNPIGGEQLCAIIPGIFKQ